MKCPVCGRHQERTIDSREEQDGAVVRRRHACQVCAHRWTTYEIPKTRLTEREETSPG